MNKDVQIAVVLLDQTFAHTIVCFKCLSTSDDDFCPPGHQKNLCKTLWGTAVHQNARALLFESGRTLLESTRTAEHSDSMQKRTKKGPMLRAGQIS